MMLRLRLSRRSARQLDTTILPVKVRETVFGDPVSVHLTLALDGYTHTLVAFRLTLVSDSAVDVAMLLRDMTMPLPMRPDWGEELEWPYPGLPAAVVAEFAGHKVAGLPFFTPETITTDHGAVYRNHHLVEVQRVLGANILLRRVASDDRVRQDRRMSHVEFSGKCWIADATTRPDLDESGFGAGWNHVGNVARSEEDLWQHLAKVSRKRSAEFYISISQQDRIELPARSGWGSSG